MLPWSNSREWARSWREKVEGDYDELDGRGAYFLFVFVVLRLCAIVKI